METKKQNQNKPNKTAILIDGNSMLFRMFYGVRGMSNSKGVPTNGVFGFVKLLMQIQNEMTPDYLAIAFDLKEPTFRHKKYDAYKAGRDKMPDELITQFDIMRDIIAKMGIACVTKAGFEADDIIGTLANHFAREGVMAKIMTGDRDSFQLVDDNIHILYTTTRSTAQFVEVDNAYIMDKYGVTPKDLIQVKALMGDTSDNIPGIKGVGEKTALKFVKKYGTVDGLYAHVDELKGKQKEKVIAGKDDAYLSLFLGKIDTDVPLDVTDDDMAMHPLFNDDVIAVLTDLEFSSLLRRLSAAPKNGEAADVTFSVIDDDKDLYFALNRLSEADTLTLYAIEEAADDASTNLWLSFLDGTRIRVITDTALASSFLENLMDLPNADTLQIVSHDLKTLSHIMAHHDVALATFGFDTYIAAYLLEPSDRRYDLSDLATKYLDRAVPSEEALLGKGKKKKRFADLTKDTIENTLATHLDVIVHLKEELSRRLDETGMTTLYEQIELPLVPVLAAMESYGFAIDVDQLEKLSDYFENRIDALTKSIYEEAGQSFNINSTKQLGSILFEEMGLPPVKKTKTGYSTSVEVLEQLKPYSPIVGDILEYRSVTKLDSTYGRGLIKYVDPDTHRLYSTFNQTVTATGRISSSDPNLQNIPVRTELGREIRRVFVPSGDDYVLLDADYSQIELRVLAHLTGDANLIDSFMAEEDIHRRTASEIFGVPLEDVTPAQRSSAKAINFGLIYGKQAFSLGKELGISRSEAQSYIDMYFSRYPKVSEYMHDVVAEAKKDGYTTTLYGRRRYIPELNSRNGMLRQSGERIALNTPIQGTAADIMKVAMIRVYNKLKAESHRAHLILQIHDELIIDAPKDEADTLMTMLIDEMENAAALKVPLVVDAHMGHSWYELK